MEDTEHRTMSTARRHESVDNLLSVRIIPNYRSGTRRNDLDIEVNPIGHM